MNGSTELAGQLAGELKSLGSLVGLEGVRVMICPPFPLIAAVREAMAGLDVTIGAQNCHTEDNGAFTGDVSASMLGDAGVSAVLLGHSERRISHGESSAQVAEKFARVRAARMMPIVCVGETTQQHKTKQTAAVLRKQVVHSLPSPVAANPSNWMLAYEPIWSIGTGLAAQNDDVVMAATVLNESFVEFRDRNDDSDLCILYGGSVTADNARALASYEGISGLLVGSASLDAEEFAKIILAVAS